MTTSLTRADARHTPRRLERLGLDPGALEEIGRYAVGGQVNIWATSSDAQAR